MDNEASKYIPKPPRQVSEATAAVDAYINANGGQLPGDGQPQQQPAPNGVVAPPAPTHPGVPSAELAPPPAQPQGAGTQPPVQPGVEDDASWERRYKALEGRHQTIAKNYAQQADRLNNLETLIATFQAGGAVAPQTPDPAELRPSKLLTPAEVEEYGEDFLGVIGKRSQEAISPELQAINLKINLLADQVKGAATVIQKTQKQQFYADVTSAVPEWRAINRDPQFSQWVDQLDPYSGEPRRKMLLEAFTRQDARRVVNFFSGFLTEATGTPPNGSSPGNGTTPLPGNGQGNGRPSLEQFAAPGRARSAPQGNLPPEKPVYTSATIAKFMGDKLKGLWRGREADAAAIEADIFLAQREGRIQV